MPDIPNVMPQDFVCGPVASNVKIQRMRTAVAQSIGIYQRYVSPYKGFSCAHNHVHARGSCSEYGKRVVLRYGVLRFLPLLFRRFADCRSACVRVAGETQSSKPDNDVDFAVKYCAFESVANVACCAFMS